MVMVTHDDHDDDDDDDDDYDDDGDGDDDRDDAYDRTPSQDELTGRGGCSKEKPKRRNEEKRDVENRCRTMTTSTWIV